VEGFQREGASWEPSQDEVDKVRYRAVRDEKAEEASSALVLRESAHQIPLATHPNMVLQLARYLHSVPCASPFVLAL